MADNKDSFMLDARSSGIPTKSPDQRSMFMAQNILRILAIVLSATSIAVMVTNNQTVSIFTFQFEAHYYYSSSLKFLVAANAIVCGFSVLTLIITNLLLRQQGSQRRGYYFFLFLHDMVITLLIISGCVAATAIGYVGQYGESHVGWMAICDRVSKFCRTNFVSVLLSYLAFFAYLGLTILTAYKCITSSPHN